MVERALLTVLIALVLIVAASSVADAFTKMTERMECAFQQTKVCIIDGDVE